MFRRALMRGLPALFLIAGTPLTAQTAPTVSKLTARLQELNDSLHALIEIQDSLAASASSRMDTLSLGRIPVVMDHVLLPSVRPLLDSLNTVIDSLMDGSTGIRNAADTITVKERFTGTLPQHGVQWQRRWNPRKLARVFMRIYGKAALETVPPGIVLWTGQDLLPDAVRGSTYRSLATADVVAATRCLEGSVAGCRSALMLSGDPNPEDVYTTDQMVRFVSRLRLMFIYRKDSLDCINGRKRQVCTELLRQVWSNHVPSIPIAAQQALLASALHMGGRGALARFIAGDSDDIRQRLEAAARAPLDSIVRQFLTEVRSNRPSSTVGTSTMLGSLMWTAVFLALALRNKRWQ